MAKDPMSVFKYALKSPESKRQYPNRFKVFLDFLNFPGDLDEQAHNFLSRARDNPKWAQHSFMMFVMRQIERAKRGEIAEATISNCHKATKLFCEMNELPLNWTKIAKGIPKGRRAANDRIPTIEEIRKLLEYPDRRIKPIVFTMISAGIRIGAWDTLQWKHITPITNSDGSVIAARILVYPGDQEEYYSFITPEAYKSLKDWMDFRGEYGERISGDSWVMRDIWQTSNVNYGAKWGLATMPKKLRSSAIKRLIERALWEQGIRKPLPLGKNRHEWKAAHGFRKFYKTRAEQAMRPANVELTMGHDLGVSKSYYKPTEQEILEDYVKAIDQLTIYNTHNRNLENKIRELSERNESNEFIIRSKLQEKDDALSALSDQVLKLTEQINALKKNRQY